MKAKSNQLTVESMTQRYSLGHKALSVALSVVLMGFGWPAVSPSQVYAGDGAAADDAAVQVEGTSFGAATSSADKVADTAASSAASAASSAAPAASEQPASTTSQQQAAPSASEPAQPAGTQQDESAKKDADTADVELVLGNASITYMNQVVSAPAHKVTVPVNDDFKFTVSPDNGYSLTKAVLKVSGKENPISPDEQGVYTVFAADVAAGATVTLETEAVSSDSGKDNAAVSIEDEAAEEAQVSVSGAGAISGPTSVAQGNTITLTYNGDMIPQNWFSPEQGLFSEWNVSADKKTLTLKATDNWAFVGSKKTATICMEYTDQSDQWHTGVANSMTFDVTVKKRSFTVVQPEPVAEGQDHFWIPQIKDNETGRVFSISDAPDGAFLPLEYYRDGQRIENASQYRHDTNEFSKPGTYTVVVKPDNGWIYDFEGMGQIEIAIPTKKPDNTDFEKWIYVGESVDLEGDEDAWWGERWKVSSGSENVELSGSGNVKGLKVGDATVVRGFYSPGWHTETFTIHVMKKPAATSLSISGADTVEQFKNITLTTDSDTDVTWTSSDPSVATIDASGKVVGVKPGKVTITATTVTAEGKVLTATHEVTVKTSGVSPTSCYLFFQNSPTANPDSNGTASWFPSGGNHALGVKVNLDGLNLPGGKNSYDNVANRVTQWPDGSTGSSWVLDRNGAYSQYWNAVFRAWKDTLSKEQGTQITEDDVEEIALYPYKISNNTNVGCGYHLDCKVVVKCSKAINAVFYLQDADASGFAQYDAATYRLEKGIAQVTAPSKTPADEKTVNGVKYKFMGWYSDQACTQAVSFPMRTSENVNYYGKYVACDQSIQVNYYLKGTTTQVAPSKTLSGYMKGQTVVQSPISIEGYKPVSDETKSGVVGTDSSIDFYYTANPADYSVEYYWTGSDKPLSSEKRSGHVGDQVTGLEPKAIAGYTPVNDNVQDLKLGADEFKNVVKFYYRQNVSLTANFDSKTYNGSEQSVDGYTTNLPEGVSTSFDGVTLEGGKGTNAGDYPYTFANGTIGKVSSDNNYVVTRTMPGNLHISPVADEVVVKIAGKSATLPYSGSEQSVTGYSFATSDGRYREANVKFQGEAVAKGTNAGTYNMNLASGQFSNTSGNFTNVEFVVVDGSLEITGGDLDADKVVWDVHDVQKVYDGTPLSAYVAKATDKFGNALKVEYSTDGEQWTDDPSSITLTHFGAQLVMLRATSPNYAADQYAENGEWVAITSRPVTLTSKGDNKKYDGEPLTNDTVTVETKGEGTGFIDGEGVTIKVTGSQTDAGESDNTFDYTFNEGTNANDYWVKTELGKLVVTASDSEVVATIAGHNKSVEYNGLEQSVEGYDFVEASSKLYGEGDFAFSGTAVAKGTDVGTYKMNLASEQFANTSKNFSKVTFAVTDGTLTITPKSIIPDPENPKNTMSVDSPAVVVYNGQDQTWTPVVKDGERKLEPGKDYTVEYSTADRTNVTGEITVTIKGINNYSGEVKRTYQITKRPVELKSEGGSKPYDGTALVKPEVSGWQQQGDTGFVMGEVSNVRATGSVTTVAQGEVANSIAYDTNAGFNANNYAISKDEGKLSITALAAEDGITITPNNATYIYDASSHEAGAATASASVAGTDVNLEYRVKGSADTEWRSNASAITAINAGALTVEVRASAANYSGYKYAEQTLTIQKRDVELTSASASKVYDGAPLAKDWVDMGPNRPDTGFIWTDLAGDGRVHAKGSQTGVGSSENAISYQLKPGAENNYNIIGEHVGTLTVTAQSIAPDPQNPDSYKGVAIDEPSDHVYDGAEHKWAPEVTDKDGNKLVEGSDYTVTYDTDDFVNVKVVNVTIAGMGSYMGTCVKAYEITKAPLTVNAGSASKVYDGEALTAGATIEGLVGGENATAQTQGSQTEVGSSANTVSRITWDTAKEGNYYIAAQNDGTLTVTPKGVAQMAVGSLPDVTYNGESQQQKPVVKDGEKVLAEGVDYELTYSGNTTDAGTVTVTVTGKGNYAGSVERAYRITPAPLTVSTPSASRVYNGKPLTAAGTISGFVNGESAPFETTGSQTEVGTSDNTYAIDWAAAGATAKQANYAVSESIGKLTVTESADEVVVTTTGGTFAYDGASHGAAVTVGALPEGYTLEAAASSATATSVSDGEVAATADVLVIKNAQGEDVTSKLNVKFVDGTIKVEPAKLTVTTPSASKPYDGNALTAEGKASGFVNGETATLKTTGGQTTVGTSENGYELVWDGNAKAANYTVEENLGTLEVTKSMAGIVVIPQGGTKVYDGTALESAGVNVIGVPAGFTLSAKTKGFVTDAGYAAAEVDSYVITNAAGQDVTDQFGNVATGKASLVVTKRPVTLVSGDASKVYDGTALTEHKVSVEDGSLASGEEFGYDFFGFQTSVGSSKNTFAAKPGNDSTKVENYDIAYRYGTLTVSAQSINPDDPIPGAYAGVKVNAPSDAVYDAREHKWIPVVTGKDGNALVEGRDYTVAYSTDDFTNVTGTIKVTITGIGDYTGSVTREYQIAPASVKLASNTREFVYNGAYQSDDAVTVQGAEALFRSQVDDLKAVGRVMTVAEGKVPNTIAYTWKDGFKASNFAIEKSEGELSVVAKDIVSSADMTVSSPSDLVYDGKEHKWAPEVKDVEKLLTEGVDYTVSYGADDFTNVTGDIKVTVTGKGNYAGSVERAYRITPAPLTVSTPSASRVYNGKPLTAAGTISGFVNGESAPFETTGSQTEVGTSDNTYAIDWAAAGATVKQANYAVSESIGKLTVTEFAGRVVATPGSYSGVYDGQAHGVDVTVSGLPEGYSVKAAHSNATATDATDEAGVTASVDELVIVNAQGEDVTGKLDIEKQTGAIKIAPAEYHVVTEGAFKVYDGTALTAPGKIVGLVNGEEASLSVIGSQTDAGSSANTYAIAFDKSAKEGNYVHGADAIGSLEVTAAKAEGKISLSGSSASKVYDGKPLAAKAASAAVPTQDAVTIEYSLDGENWTTDPGSLAATDVADSATVQLRASSPGNYEGYVYGSQQLSVTKRAVDLKSDSASKVFDGIALTRPEVTGWKQLGDEGFVDGQVSAVRATGSATHVSDGKVANTIVYTEGESFNADNYAISKDEGVLSVTAKQIAAADMAVQAPADVVYSGKAQQQKPVVKNGDKTLVEGVDYELTYSGNATDAGTVTVTVTGKGDYAGSIDVAYRIAPAPLTVVTESANKVYDGKPLTAGGKVDGLVNGETVEFKVVGSQTKVGESDNAYKIEWNGTAKRANYRLETETIGKLTVTESADEVVVTTTGGTFAYDGASHGAAVTVGALPEGYTLEAAASSATATSVSDGEVAATADVLVIKNAQGEDVTSKLNVKFVDGTIKVEPAKLTVTTPSASKPYDGNALTAEGKASGFVNGETATLKTTGGQTTVGTSENGYELVWDGNAKAANYTVEENLGTLTVSAQSIDPDDAGAFGGVTVGYLTDTVYNGADQRFEPEVVDKDGRALVKGRDYELSFSGDVKNVGEVTVAVVGKGNYAGSVERTYRIMPASLMVTTGSDSKIYDGSELVNNELSIEGLQGEDRVTAAATGSQTEVGSSENTYRITWGDVDAANYVIDEHLGTLTVTPAPVPPTPNPDDGTTPTPEPTPSPTPGDGSTPGSTPDGTTPGSTPNPAPAAAGPLDVLAGVLEGAYESVTGSPEADNPVEEERIYDAENPLGRESVEDHCWVHWCMIVGMVLTAVYGLAAALRRKNHERRLRNDMNDVLGDGDGKDPSGSPAVKPAGMEA